MEKITQGKKVIDLRINLNPDKFAKILREQPQNGQDGLRVPPKVLMVWGDTVDGRKFANRMTMPISPEVKSSLDGLIERRKRFKQLREGFGEENSIRKNL